MITNKYIVKFLKRSGAILLLSLLAFTGTRAQDVSFTASAPNVVREGEQFNLTYSLDQQPDNVQLPDMNNFQVLGGPSTSSSTSVQIINGKMTRSSSVSYTYMLTANSKGKYTIPPATATVKGKTYQSNSISIEVLPGNAPSSAGSASSGNAGSSQQQGESAASSQVNANGKNVFVRLLVSKKEAYVGQEIIAWVKLYTRVPIADFDRSFSGPEFTGFYKQDIDLPPLRSLERENVDGQIYNAGTLMKVILFPQRSGDITIKPFDLDVLVQQSVQPQSRSIFDDFFSQTRNVKVTLTGNSVKFHIKPLPSGQPASFNGAVGKFNIDASLSNATVKTNQAVTLKVNVTGSGNLKLLDNPTTDIPPDIESYDPTTTSNIKNTSEGETGEKTFEYTLIPRYAGNFNIPPVKLTYFDPDTKSYHTVSTRGFNITVEKGEEDTSGVVVSGLSKEEVKLLGSDIHYIKTGGLKLKHQGIFLFGTLIFNLTFIVVFMLFLLIIILRREAIRRNADIIRVKNRKASKYARKRLKLASKLLHQQKQSEFYEEVSKALWGYLSDKLSIPVAKLSRESSQIELAKRKIDEALINEFFDLIDTCEFARFAPSSEATDMNKIYNNAAKIIGKLQQKIK